MALTSKIPAAWAYLGVDIFFLLTVSNKITFLKATSSLIPLWKPSFVFSLSSTQYPNPEAVEHTDTVTYTRTLHL